MSRFNSIAKLAQNQRFGNYVIGLETFPINVEISPTGHCNANCPDCLYRNDHYTGFIDQAVVLKLLGDMRDCDVSSVTWSGCGEPTIHPHFNAFVDGARCFHQGIFTNGLQCDYDASLIDWIRVTVTPHDFTLGVLQDLRKAKALGFCVKYGVHGREDLKRALEAAHMVDADYVHVRPVLHKGGALPDSVDIAEMLEIDDPLIVYDDDKFRYTGIRGYSECRGYHFAPFVWHDGIVTACAYIRDKREYVLGDLNEQPFCDIVKSMRDFVPVCDECMAMCKNHEINGLIDAALKVQDKYFV